MKTLLAQLMPVRLIFVLLATLFFVAACDDDDATPLVENTALFSEGELDKNLEEIRAENDLPALAAFVIDGDGLLETAAVGERSKGSGVEVTTDDMWHLGSITKSMTATLAAVLVDEGIVRWDTTIMEVFPEADNILEKYRELELQQLLSMTGGVSDDVDNPAVDQLEPDDITRAQRILGVPLALSLDHEKPIGEFLYANTSYLLAAAMLEKSTNQDWRDLLTSKVLSRLNIDEFGFGPPGTEGQLDQPLGHMLIDGEYQSVFEDNPAILDPAGRVHMSLNDIAAYAAFHLKGKSGDETLLSSDVMQELYRGRTPEGSVDPEKTSQFYALGWIVDTVNDTAMHDGSNTFWYALLVIDFRRDFAMFVVTNAPVDTVSEKALIQVLSLIDERVDDSAGDTQP